MLKFTACHSVAAIRWNLGRIPKQNLHFAGSIDKLVNRRRVKYGAEFEVSSSLLQTKIDGFFDNNRANGNSVASRVEIEYRYAAFQPQRIVLSNKFRDRSTDTTNSYSLDS